MAASPAWAAALHAGAPAELHEQSEIVTHGAVQGDLAIDDGKDVYLFVDDRLSGNRS
jgi:hypothetical protein